MKLHGACGRVSATEAYVSLLYRRACPASTPDADSRRVARSPGGSGWDVPFPDVVGPAPTEDGVADHSLVRWFPVTVTRRHPVTIKGKGLMPLFWVDWTRPPSGRIHGAGGYSSERSMSSGGGGAVSFHETSSGPSRHAPLADASARIGGASFKIRTVRSVHLDVPRLEVPPTGHAVAEAQQRSGSSSGCNSV